MEDNVSIMVMNQIMRPWLPAWITLLLTKTSKFPPTPQLTEYGQPSAILKGKKG
jgi:hypothetical protein